MTIIPHTRRRLKCEDPRSVKTLLTSHGLLQAAEILQASISGPLTNHQIREFERIDKVTVKFMLKAEKNVANLRQEVLNSNQKYSTSVIELSFGNMFSQRKMVARLV